MSRAEGAVGGWSCPLPLRDYPLITLAHGGGGKLSAELVRHLFLPAFGGSPGDLLSDAAVLNLQGSKLAFTTDSYVVHPLFFPGGDIGQLAVHGTVNDLAMVGAKPLFLSCGFILEEGFPTSELAQIAQSMGAAARSAGVKIVTGDTKVVERGRGHGVYINTSGVGEVPSGREIAPRLTQAGDLILLSGTLGDHGMAVMSVREGLRFEAEIESDTASVWPLVDLLLERPGEVRAMRDPTRGGLASALNEIAQASGLGILLEEESLPINDAVRSACELLGLDPLYVANEGKLLAVVDPAAAPTLLAALHSHPLGRKAALIGRVTEENPGLVALKTPLGASRLVDTLIGEQLPRIC